MHLKTSKPSLSRKCFEEKILRRPVYMPAHLHQCVARILTPVQLVPE